MASCSPSEVGSRQSAGHLYQPSTWEKAEKEEPNWPPICCELTDSEPHRRELHLLVPRSVGRTQQSAHTVTWCLINIHWINESMTTQLFRCEKALCPLCSQPQTSELPAYSFAGSLKLLWAVDVYPTVCSSISLRCLAVTLNSEEMGAKISRVEKWARFAILFHGCDRAWQKQYKEKLWEICLW